MPVFLVVFRVGAQRFALPIAAVERIVAAVEVTPLPGAPGIVLGAIDVAGTVVPVLDLRGRLRLPACALVPHDQFLLARMADRRVALVVDEALGVVDQPASAVTGAAGVVPGLERFQGIVRLADGLVLIHDLDAFLSLDEARLLDQAIGAAPLSC